MTSVAGDLDSGTARAQLCAGLVDLERDTAGLAEVEDARGRLLADPDLAWRLFACALLADALSE